MNYYSHIEVNKDNYSSENLLSPNRSPSKILKSPNKDLKDDYSSENLLLSPNKSPSKKLKSPKNPYSSENVGKHGKIWINPFKMQKEVEEMQTDFKHKTIKYMVLLNSGSEYKSNTSMKDYMSNPNQVKLEDEEIDGKQEEKTEKKKQQEKLEKQVKEEKSELLNDAVNK